MKFNLKLNLKYISLFSFFVFLVIEVSDLLLPFESKSGAETTYLVYYSIFFFLFFSFFLISHVNVTAKVKLISLRGLENVVRAFVLLALISIIFVAYDRLFIQGVSYDQGIAQARESWRSMAQSRHGVSSFYSVVGNLLFPIVFFAFSLCFTFYEFSSAMKIRMFICIVLVFIFSILTGGRELLLVLCSVSLSAAALRVSIGLPLLPHKLKLKIFVVFALVVGFSLYVAYLRSKSYTEGLLWYSDSLATRLGGKPQIEGWSMDLVSPLLMPVLIYLAHVKWIFLNVIELSLQGGLSTFRQVFLIINQYSPVAPDMVQFSHPEYAPNWISLVGSVFYDLGYLGVVILVILLCFFMIFSFYLFKVKEFNVSLFSVFFFYFIGAIVIFSPFAFMLELVQFIYLIIPLLVCLVFSFFISALLSESECK